MKKTLIAVAALSAMAASAMAANVTVSGVVDLGFAFQNNKVTNKDTVRTFKMNSGQNSGSRVMFKGAEDLGNNVEVGFQLESGFKADNGTMEEGRLFRRESRLYVKTAYGTLHAGRYGALESGTGSLSIFGGSDMAAFSTGWSDVMSPTNLLKITPRYDNSIAYQSPTFAGVSLYVMHSLKENDKDDLGTEGRPSSNRYNGVGLKYVNGAFNAAFVASQQNYASLAGGVNPDNGQVYSLGAGYDFGVCKVMAEGQYFDMGKDSVPSSEQVPTKSGVEKGWGTIISVTAPVAGGKIYASAGYKDAEDTMDSDVTQKTWSLGLGYSYNLSKRTMLYAAAGYQEVKDETANDSTKKKTTTVLTGLVHKF